MRFISRYDEDIMELYDEDPQDGTYYRGKESDEFYDPDAPFGYDRDERHEERKKHAALYMTAHKELLENADYLKAYNRILDEYAREYAYVILEKPISVVSDQERENERFILETFISDISKKKMESYKADAEYIVEWVKSGKNLIVYI